MRVYITLDYELFLGKETGSVDECLIRPTNRLESYLSNLSENAKIVFFVDALFLLRLRELTSVSRKLKDEFERIVSQLQSLSIKGHDIQLHLHPQWFYSEYDFVDEKWILDFEHYRLEDCPQDDVDKMVRTGVELLESITGIRPTAYRAGGYSFPQAPEYIAVLKKYGISEDSSVFMGKKASGKYQQYDYSMIKNYQPYSFSQSVICADSDGSFTEYPISVIRVNPFCYFFVLLTEKFKCGVGLRIMGDGKGIGTTLPRWKRAFTHLLKLFKPVYMPASLDGINSYWLETVYRRVVKKRSEVMVLMGHPKLLTEYSLHRLGEFLMKSQCTCATFRR